MTAMLLEHLRHHLCAAMRFVDAFSARAIDVPLDVRVETLPAVVGMPRLPWRPVRAPEDATYRFLVSNATIAPVGAIPVAVSAPGGEYVDPEPFQLVLPRPLAAHPPTPARSDFLVEHRLWPTRALRLPAAETAIVARLQSAGATPVAGLRLTIWRSGTPMPAFPYAYANDAGEVVYRLPELKTVVGGVVTSTVSLDIDVRLPPAYAVAVVPTAIVSDVGVPLGMPFTIPLRRVTGLLITLP